MAESEFSPHQASSRVTASTTTLQWQDHVSSVRWGKQKTHKPELLMIWRNRQSHALLVLTFLSVVWLHEPTFYLCVSFNSVIPFLEIYPKEIHRQEYKDYVPKYFLKNVYNITNITNKNLNGHTKNPTNSFNKYLLSTTCIPGAGTKL